MHYLFSTGAQGYESCWLDCLCCLINHHHVKGSGNLLQKSWPSERQCTAYNMGLLNYSQLDPFPLSNLDALHALHTQSSELRSFALKYQDWWEALCVCESFAATHTDVSRCESSKVLALIDSQGFGVGFGSQEEAKDNQLAKEMKDIFIFEQGEESCSYKYWRHNFRKVMSPSLAQAEARYLVKIHSGNPLVCQSV